MAFQLSPGVNVVEKDFSAIVPAVSTSTGAFAGYFQWGPVSYPTTVSSENDLVSRFGKPNDTTFASFFSAANFLSYSNDLQVVRIAGAAARNAVSNSTGSVLAITVGGAGTGYTDVPTAVTFTGGNGSGASATANVKVVGAITIASGGTGYAVGDTLTVNIGTGTEAIFTVSTVSTGAITAVTITNAGNYSDILAASLTGVATTKLTGSGSGATLTFTLGIASVNVTAGGTGYTSAPTIGFTGGGGSGASATATISSTGVLIKNVDDYTTNYAAGQGTFGEFAAKYPGVLGNSLKVVMFDSATYASATAYTSNFSAVAPATSSYVSGAGGSNDELHVLVIDEDGIISGTAGTILEKYEYLSKAGDAKKSDGSTNYYKNVINNTSKYIWWGDHNSAGTNWGSNASGVAFASLSSVIEQSLAGGIDANTSIDADQISAYTLFANADMYDVSLVFLGKASATVANGVINALTGGVGQRNDVVIFASPQNTTSGDIITSASATAITDILAYRTAITVDTSYAVLDTGYKYQYDRYNDTYRWVPLNADIAGLCARTDYAADPWYSPGGMSRGQIKNAIKLAVNPNKADRDNLYKNNVNPVVSFPGEGTVLYGDKTLQKKASAFDRINVRRLFIVLEKAIAIAAKNQLFEFNDSFTRAQFKNIVEPFLRDVQGRRGVVDFRVVCDDTNNTAEVIDRNEFVADIYIKPNRSINYITLNFIAARSGVNFEEIGA